MAPEANNSNLIMSLKVSLIPITRSVPKRNSDTNICISVPCTSNVGQTQSQKREIAKLHISLFRLAYIFNLVLQLLKGWHVLYNKLYSNFCYITHGCMLHIIHVI